MRNLAALVVLAIIGTGCAMAGPGYVGFSPLYTSVKGPITATGLAAGPKSGEACSTNIIGLIASGDSSIEAAKAKGGIKKVATIDFSAFSVLGLYAKSCTIVKGAGGGKGEE